MITIAITAAGGGVAQSVLRSLAVSDIDHRTVGTDVSALNSGLHWVDSAHLMPRIDDPSYVDRLLRLCAEEKVDLLIPGLDTELPVLALARARFEAQGCAVVVGDPRAVHLSNDKLEFAQWCTGLGFPFVPTMSLVDAQLAADELEFPVILKPRHGSASDGARLIRTAAALRAEAPDDRLIVQKYLPPRGTDLVAAEDRGASRPDQLHEVSAQYFVSPGGEILGSFVSMNRLKAGVPVEIVPIVDQPWVDDAVPIVRALIELGARGPINLQGRLTDSGRVMFFEMNARFTGITGIRALMGYREVEAAVRSFALDDDPGAIDCLRFDPDFIGFRHVGDMIVPRDRVAALTHDRSQPIRPPNAPTPVVFISGAAGYIGHEVIRELTSSDDAVEIRAMGRSSESLSLLTRDFARMATVRPELGDLAAELPDLRAVNTVVHLAARRIPERSESEFYEINVEGTRRLIAAARQAGVKRFVYLSSQSVYGTARRPPWGEAMPLNPETSYGAAKFLGELMCRKEFGGDMEFVILRAARAYGLGARMRWEELPHQFAQRTASEGTLRINGDGSQRMDLVHVRDLARAIALSVFARLPPVSRTVVNVGGGQPVSLSELAALYVESAHALGLRPPTIDHVTASSPTPPSFGMLIRRARELLDWAPSIGLGEAVLALVQNAHESRLPSVQG